MIHNIQIVPALAPEYGGPARAVQRLSLELADLGIKVTLLFSDLNNRYQSPRMPSHPNLTYLPMHASLVQGVKPVWIPDFKSTLIGLCEKKDQVIIQDHGIWLPHNGHVAEVADRFGIPLIISPNGTLQPWALNYRKWRKIVAWQLWQKKRLLKVNLLHAASHAEADSINQLGLGKPVVVIPNGTEIPEYPEHRSSPGDGKTRMLFMSRIHPGKGLILLIKALRNLNTRDWTLTIAGYDENNHQQEVERAVVEAGLSQSIQFIGPVENERKWDTYREADLFVHPSLSENFGIVIAEALASGLPVIATTGSPWIDLTRHDCGWWIEPTIADLTSAIQEALSLSAKQRQAMGARGKRLVEEKYSWKSIAEEMKKLYQLILSGEDFWDQEIIDLSPKLNIKK